MTPDAFWDRLAPRYAARPVADPDAYAAKLAHVQALLKPTDHMLEIGCGTGSTALTLAPHVAQMTATDVSAGMIKIAETKRAERALGNVRFDQADAADTVPGGPFDVIAAFSLLHLVDDLPAVLASVYAQLKPGGLFLSKTVCLGDRNVGLRLFVRALTVVGIAPQVAPLSRASLSRALIQAGFEIRECRYFGKSRTNPFFVAARPA